MKSFVSKVARTAALAGILSNAGDMPRLPGFEQRADKIFMKNDVNNVCRNPTYHHKKSIYSLDCPSGAIEITQVDQLLNYMRSGDRKIDHVQISLGDDSVWNTDQSTLEKIVLLSIEDEKGKTIPLYIVPGTDAAVTARIVGEGRYNRRAVFLSTGSLSLTLEEILGLASEATGRATRQYNAERQLVRV